MSGVEWKEGGESIANGMPLAKKNTTKNNHNTIPSQGKVIFFTAAAAMLNQNKKLLVMVAIASRLFLFPYSNLAAKKERGMDLTER